MRRDCRLIDAVRFVARNLFADRLFKIFKICEGADPANPDSGDNNL